MYKKLNDYLKSSDRTLTELAAAAGVTKGRLSQLRNSETWPPMLALKIEKVTAGELSASELSPVIEEARQGGKAK